METVKASVICIFSAGLLGSLAMILIPGRKNNTVMKSIISIFIIVSMLEPIKNVFGKLSDLPELGQSVMTLSEEGVKAASEYVKEELSEMISMQADESNIEIISVSADISEENNCIIIHKITVLTSEKNPQKIREFEQTVSVMAGVEITVEKNEGLE